MATSFSLHCDRVRVGNSNFNGTASTCACHPISGPLKSTSFATKFNRNSAGVRRADGPLCCLGAMSCVGGVCHVHTGNTLA